jgi:hypothetical protein
LPSKILTSGFIVGTRLEAGPPLFTGNSFRHVPSAMSGMIRERLDGSANITKPFPEKPKGMHWRTYGRLWWEHEEADMEQIAGLREWLTRLERKVGQYQSGGVRSAVSGYGPLATRRDSSLSRSLRTSADFSAARCVCVMPPSFSCLIASHPGVAGADDGLRPVGHLQLEQDVGDVVSDRLQAHEEPGGYLLVALALCHQGEDLLFALG